MGKTGCSTEFQIVQPGGDLRTVTFSSQIVLDEQGSPRHIFGACQDVTETKRAQEQAFALQKLETVGTLANGIAHDFNNLLGGMLTQAELALSELNAGRSPEEELKTIFSVARSGSEIVRQLMIYTGQEQEVSVLTNWPGWWRRSASYSSSRFRNTQLYRPILPRICPQSGPAVRRSGRSS